MTSIEPNENRLVGRWINRNGEVVEDETCRRIRQLIEKYLIKLGHDASGWDTVYSDPGDQRIWELIYPASELHGGGPPELHVMTREEARKKYGAIIDG